MPHLQVKNVPPDLHAALRRRAEAAGTTVSEYVTRVLRRDLALPSLDEWVAEQSKRPWLDRDIDVAGVLDEVREDFGR